jgi:hypothetical protein
LSTGSNYNEKTANTGEALFYIGSGLTLASIPFAIASNRNKKMAARTTIVLKLEKATCMRQSLVPVRYPAVTMRINL